MLEKTINTDAIRDTEITVDVISNIAIWDRNSQFSRISSSFNSIPKLIYQS